MKEESENAWGRWDELRQKLDDLLKLKFTDAEEDIGWYALSDLPTRACYTMSEFDVAYVGHREDEEEEHEHQQGESEIDTRR